jgi:hypothetical protein
MDEGSDEEVVKKPSKKKTSDIDVSQFIFAYFIKIVSGLLDQMQISSIVSTCGPSAYHYAVREKIVIYFFSLPYFLRFSSFLRREKTSETICNQLILISMALLQIEQVDASLADLQVRAISLDTAIFMHNPTLRKDILGEAVSLGLATRKWSAKHIRSFSLVQTAAIPAASFSRQKQKIKRSTSIQMHTALILQLLQSLCAVNMDVSQSAVLNSLLPADLLGTTVEDLEQVIHYVLFTYVFIFSLNL